MKSTALGLILIGHLAACGARSDNAQLVAEVRAALERQPRILGVDGAPLVTPASSWVTSDPFEVAVHPTRNEVTCHGRSAVRGAGGLLVEVSPATPFCVRWRVRIDRADWSSNARLGLFSLDSFDPLGCLLNISGSGGEGDRRLEIELGHREGSTPLTSFELGKELDLGLALVGDTIVAQAFEPVHEEAFATVRVPAQVVPRLCMLGSSPAIDNKGILVAAFTLVAMSGLKPVPPTAPGVPIHLRDGPLADAAADNPFRQAIEWLARSEREWVTVLPQVRRLAATLRSLGVHPGIDGWLEACAVRRATDLERLAQLVAPLAQEASRALRVIAPDPDTRRTITEWRGSSPLLDLQPAQDAATLIWQLPPNLRAIPPDTAAPLLARILATCRCDSVAAAMLSLELNHPELVDYLLTPGAGADLAARGAALLSDQDPATAVALCARALDGGWCDDALGQTIEDLGEEELHARWLAARAVAPAYAAAARELERRMRLQTRL